MGNPALPDNFTGQRFGKLVAIKCLHIHHLCQCDCGNVLQVRTKYLKSRSSLSCGCSRGIAHGLKNHKLYTLWKCIRQRCQNPNHPQFKDYGGRGITICDRWNNFTLFLMDMGEKPSPKHTLDRSNNELGYSPTNCRWATRIAQTRNRRNTITITYNGETRPIAEWAEIFNLPYNVLRKRLKKERAINRALQID